MENFDLKTVLERLCRADGVSGAEENIAALCIELLGDIGKAEYDRASGNVYFTLDGHSEDKPTVLLDAHIDEIGMIVSGITDDGFLRVSACGGLDVRALPAARVTILGREKLYGVITSVPPHLQSGKEKAAKLEDLYVDTGLSGDKARELVSLGDRALIENSLEVLRGTRVTSKALDDRAGAAAVICALRKIAGKKLGCNVTALLSSREETGGAGAKTGAYTADADIAVAVDVSFAKTQGERDEDCGELGKGPMIGISPTLSRRLSEELIKIAEEKGIPYQTEVMSGRTGTNADSISTARGGIPSVTVSIPEKHMHTPAEVADLKDIENTAGLIAAFLEGVNKKP